MSNDNRIGFLNRYFRTTKLLASKNKIGPEPPPIMNTIEIQQLVGMKVPTKDTDGSNNTFVWGIHSWCDENNLVFK